MIRRGTIAASASAAFLVVAGCASIRPLEAGNDVHALLVAVRDDDRPAFEAHVDRAALRANLQAQLMDRAHSARMGRTAIALGVVLSGPASRLAEGLLLQPEVLRAVAYYYGYRPRMPVPSPLVVGSALRPLQGGRVCAAVDRSGPCLITFAREEGAWRLVDIDLGAAGSLDRRP